jgi:predicted nucleic acid-binding protein
VTLANPKKIYWDSCVWIGLINEDEDKIDRCRYVLEQAQKGEMQVWTSSLTLAEVFKKKCDGKVLAIEEAHDADFEKYIEQEFLVEVQLDHDVGVMARRLLRSHQELKKPADAIHLASAALNNVDELHTFDGDNLLGLNGKVQRRDGKMLVICHPPERVQAVLALEQSQQPKLTKPE